MHYLAVLKVVGILFGIFSLFLIPPIAISIYYDDGALIDFVLSFFIIFVTGFVIWFVARKNRKQLGTREGFLTVAAFWVSLAIAGTLPFLLWNDLDISFTDAFFESMSGLTTTGASVLTNLGEMPISILYYRSQLQWIGGMGIIVLAVAVLPMLGIGGMQLYLAEMPGVMKHSKLTPRIKETAKALWYIYVGLTFLCALAYWLAGMSLFDAITHSYSTIAIGGFSTHDDSFHFFYDNNAILFVGIFFMLAAGVNFSLHFRVWSKRSIRQYLRDTEFKVYLSLIFCTILLVTTVLILTDTTGDPWDRFKRGVFQVVSMATTSGFTIEDYSKWPLFLPAILLAASIIGGCTGSTAGGLKVMRVIMLFKQGRREILQLIHPDAIIPIRMSGQSVPNKVVSGVWGFFALYIVSFVVLALLVLATGVDLVTAYSTVTACLNNLGPALGDAVHSYASLPDAAKWILAFTMLLGRLELLTLLILLTPRYWQD